MPCLIWKTVQLLIPHPKVGILFACQQAGCNGVQKTSGATAFTRIPFVAKEVASDDSSYTTEQVMHVNGGQYKG